MRMLNRLLGLLIMTSAASASAASVGEIEQKIAAAKAAGKHIWIQVLDDSSVFLQDSSKFEQTVFTSSFKSAIGSNFEVIEVRSSEMSADPELNKWVTQFKPAGKLATILLDSRGLIYLKQNPTEAMERLLGNGASAEDAQKFFADSAQRLKGQRADLVDQWNKNDEIRQLPFLQSAIRTAQATGQPILVKLTPTGTSAGNPFFGSLFNDTTARSKLRSTSAPVEASESNNSHGGQVRKFSPNLPSIVGGVPPRRQGQTQANTSFLVLDVPAVSLEDLPADQARFLELVGAPSKQGILAIVQPSGAVDVVVEPIGWVNQNRSSIGGPFRIDDMTKLLDWLADQPHRARDIERSKYCGGALSFLSGF
jgi:hypothetical protein